MSEIEFGRASCGDLAAAERREWLLTNGLGGFASGTVAGSLTRRYHGLLFAATPPARRTLLVTKVDEVATYAGQTFELATNRWRSGAIAPAGFTHIERFSLRGSIPEWHYALADGLLEKTIWMEHGVNATYVRYKHARGRTALQIALKVFANVRDLHALARAGGRRMNVTAGEGGLRVEPSTGAPPFFVFGQNVRLQAAHEWYYDYRLSVETERGLDDIEDHLCVGAAIVDLQPGETFALVVTDTELPSIDAAASLGGVRAREAALVDRWERLQPAARTAPAWIRRCVVAADSFIVTPPGAGEAPASTIIAGYPWFGAWSRDAMIALPGLTLATGRADFAARLLRSFAKFVDDGMLPNYFPDAGEAPEYNTVDAALWFIEAVAAYVDATEDFSLLGELFPVLDRIVAAYCEGTRFGIGLDEADGLVRAGAPGVQLTWMDAKVGEHVITPRIGKPIEISALWYQAQCRLATLAPHAARPAAPFVERAARTKAGFARFWNADLGYCYDVLDGPAGDDATLRPNQLFAVSLRYSPLDAERQRAVVAACAGRLFASTGLRSLDPLDVRYVGHYGGSPAARDAAYHQGTSWLWLLGVFATAHARAYRDPAGGLRYLEGFADATLDAGLGTLGELADGDPPFLPRGALAQAWSVGEALRAYHELQV